MRQPSDHAGVWTALVTPFNAEGTAVDEAALRDLVEMQIDGGVDVLVPCGTTGESPTLSHEEHDRVVEIVVESARGRVPVVAGTGSNSTREALRLTHHAREAGADAALVVTPYYNKPSARMLEAHYAALATQVDLPLVVYDVPSRTGISIDVETVARLRGRFRDIVGFKAANGSVEYVARLRAACDIGILSGDDALTAPMIEAGAAGVISVASNVVPAPVVELVRRARSGDVEGARELQERLASFFDALFVEPNPVPVKAARALLGQGNDVVRAPLLAALPETRALLERELTALG